MEATCSCEISVDIHRTTRRDMPEDRTIRSYSETSVDLNQTTRPDMPEDRTIRSYSETSVDLNQTTRREKSHISLARETAAADGRS
jgi:hypothetical protein